jgi:quercetin dioxygenase-like cupin family protein
MSVMIAAYGDWAMNKGATRHLQEQPMRDRSSFWPTRFAASLMLLTSGAACGEASTAHAVSQSLAETRFSAFPGLPSCTPGSVKNGDPANGPSIILAKAATGCTVPWHWHSSSEHLMMVSGTARVEVKSGQLVTLGPGDYAMLPGAHVHQFVCTSSCLFYVHSDGAFDIHYVNEQGNEIPPDQALKLPRRSTAKKQ